MATLPPGFWDGERQRLAAEMGDLVMKVLIAGGTSGIGALPQSAAVLVNWDVFNQHALDWMKLFMGDSVTAPPFVDKVGWEWARGLTDTTRRGVTDEINAWVQAGEPLPELEKRLERLPTFDRRRAKQTAVTEVTRIYASGNLMAWDASGVVGAKEWRTAVDELVCPICGPMHMTIVEMDQPWRFTQAMREASPELDRALKSLNQAAFNAPPAHVNCRCWLAPVVLEAMTEQELQEQQFPPRTVADDIADEIAFIEGMADDPFSDILPPPGRAPRGLGQEYKTRRRIVSRIKTQMSYRNAAEQQLKEYRGQTGTRARWRIDVAQERVNQLNKAISTMLNIASDEYTIQAGNWSFVEELVDGIIDHVSAMRVMSQ